MSSKERYQIALIGFAALALLLFGVFFWRELFPEYKRYQKAYLELEALRSSYTGAPLPPFKEGIKQIVLLKEDKGPPVIDRCTSCHVALDLPHFSEKKIARNLQGEILRDAEGRPLLVENEESVWSLLDRKIGELKSEGDFKEAERLEALKTVRVGGEIFDMKKVLSMHPLIGREERPFEHHPQEEYGCTVCHSGNGRGLTTDRAHGPVFDGAYEKADEPPSPQFLEEDPENDPLFAKTYNHKPGHRLLFQTTPILVGDLMQARCAQCHTPTEIEVQRALLDTGLILKRNEAQHQAVMESFLTDWRAMELLVSLRRSLLEEGADQTLQNLEERQKEEALSEERRSELARQEEFLRSRPEGELIEEIDRRLTRLAGSVEEAESLSSLKGEGLQPWELFLAKHPLPTAEASAIEEKALQIHQKKEVLEYLKEKKSPLEEASEKEFVLSGLKTSVDPLMGGYLRGRRLFVSQGCYACHRIAGFSRGGIGPELTQTGMGYPWFIKESIVWPQADLKTSTMPNMALDHEEVEDLMAFLLAQRSDRAALSAPREQLLKRAWEEGAKEPIERPIDPAEIEDLRSSMRVFASEGCASCHRLKGFDSDVGFSAEKQGLSKERIEEERSWFRSLFPEGLLGSKIVEMAEKHAEEIDRRVVLGVRKEALLEEIEERHPQLIESFYSNFKFASRARNSRYQNDPEKLKRWRERIHRILMAYVQEYGLGRLIGPRPNWSGVYRSDQWLMEHFWNPSGHVPRSIMPVFPFDNTKFLALTYMLNRLGENNRKELQQKWSERGFSPQEAFQALCSQCHGILGTGNGPVSEWIYPIPKNLRNPFFLRNLTKERALRSILHGVKGTPMPPWGEVGEEGEGEPVLSREQAESLVDWLFQQLPGERLIPSEEAVPKWQWGPEDVLRELKESGDQLEGEEKKLPEEGSLGRLFALLLTPFGSRLEASQETALFDLVPSPDGSEEPSFYYIKKRYYTPENLKAAETFFLENCAVCHGSDAAGAGVRAEIMLEAKPRMLINLDWLETKDDLRLLRSIKFGVPGTSMTPWGDFTTSLQRLQLVMFIRKASELQRKKRAFSDLLYRSFDSSLWAIQQARKSASAKPVAEEIASLRFERYLVEKKGGELEQAALLYEREAALERKKESLEQLDGLFARLVELVSREKRLVEELGSQFFVLKEGSEEELFERFLERADLLKARFSYKEGELLLGDFPKEKASEAALELRSALDRSILSLEKKRERLLGRLPSRERDEELKGLEAALEERRALKELLLVSLKEIEKLKEEEAELLNSIKGSLKPHGTV